MNIDPLTRLRTHLRRGEEMLATETVNDAAYHAWTQSIVADLQEAFPGRNYKLPWPVTHLGDDQDQYRKRALSRQVGFVEELIKQSGARPEVGPTAPVEPDLLDAFVSHSSQDEQLAEALVNLFRAAIDIPPKSIRCTSVSGYKLEGGSDFEQQLQIETLRSTVFVSLVTPNISHSTFTMFEVGARWGSKRRIFPILARGVTPGNVGRPLSSLTLIRGTNRDEMMHFVESVSKALARQTHSPALWLRALDSFIEAANELVTVSKAESNAPPLTVVPPIISDEAKQLLIAASEGGSGTITRVSDGVHKLIIRAYRKAVEVSTGHERAIWQDAIQELVTGGYVEQSSSSGNVFRLRKKGYDLVKEFSAVITRQSPSSEQNKE